MSSDRIPSAARGRIGVGLIGLGNISRSHQAGYRSAADGADVVAVCDLDELALATGAAAFGATAYTDHRRLLNDPAVDSVDVTLPHHLHYPVVRDALEAGKHVLVEKPLAVRSSECRELIDLARERDLVFTVAENTRFVDAYLATQRVLEQGSLGAIRTIRTLIYGSEVARVRAGAGWVGLKEAAGGGVILDAGVHSFYLLEWLFAPVVEVRASMATLIEGNEVEDNAVVTGRLENGALFTCELTCTAEIPWGERLEVCGEHRTLIVDQLTNPVAKVFAGGEDFAGAQLDGVPFDPRGWKETSIAAGVVDFVRAVRDRRPTGVDPEAGYHAVVVAERAYESVGTGGTTVGVSASVTAP